MSESQDQLNKQIVRSLWAGLDASNGESVEAAWQHLSAQHVFQGFDPISTLAGVSGFLHNYWLPLRNSFPDLVRHTHIFMAGQSNGRVDGDLSRDGQVWVGATGLYEATFARDYLGIPASGKSVSIRWGDFYRMVDGRIVETYTLIDLIDLIQQVGIPVLPPSRGKDHIYPAPAAKDGVMMAAQEPALTSASLAHIREFIFQGLNRYDRSELKSMGMARYFNPDVQWYGPGGIGACLGLREFEELHQRPWLVAFPDRQVQNLTALIAEGAYLGGPGWAGVLATHTGPYLECPATNRRIAINGMDWWKRSGDQYVENWVFVDMIHLFRQFDIDLLARIRRA